MTLKTPPDGWGSDALSKLFIDAQENMYATYVKLASLYSRLASMIDIFEDLAGYLENQSSGKVLPAMMFHRSRSALAAGLRLAMAGQVTEAYPLYRLSLEFALYGFYMDRNPDSQEIWLKRHESKEDRRKVRSRFRVSSLRKRLRKDATVLDKHFGDLYEECIDLGAHPNERSVSQSASIDGNRIDSHILTADRTVIEYSSGKALEIGELVLRIFGLIFRERYYIMGVSSRLNSVSSLTL